MTLVYRTAGAWGAGKGSDLTPAEVDGNFYGLDQRVGSLEANPPQAISIDHITQAGNALTVYMTDGTTEGPFTIPSAQWNWKGTWKPNFLYSPMDVFSFLGGIFLTLQQHTSPATFDATLQVSGSDALAVLMSVPSLPYDIGMFYPLAIPDDSSVLAQYIVTRDASIPANFSRSTSFLRVACTSALSFPILINEVQVGSIDFTPGANLEAGGPGQFGILTMPVSSTIVLARLDAIKILAPPSTAGQDATAAGLSVTISANTTGFTGSAPVGSGPHMLEDDSDVVVASPSDKQALIYDAASGTWKNGRPAMALSQLTDTNIVGTPTDGYVLTWDNASSKWLPRPGGAGGSATLAGDSDVHIVSVADKQALIYDNGTSKWINSLIAEGSLTLSDVTTWNVSTTRHGFAPKAPNDATKYLDGTGAYSVPSGGGSSTLSGLTDVTISSAADTEILVYDGSASKWKNRPHSRAQIKTVSADFATWVNQVSASAADVANGWQISTSTFPASGDSLQCRVKSCLSLAGSWDAYAKISKGYFNTSNMISGMMVRESGTGKIDQLGFAHPGVSNNRWTSPTAFSATPLADTGAQLPLEMWVRFRWDSAAGKYQWFISGDGVTWIQWGKPYSKTVFFTTTFDQIGFFINPSTGTSTPANLDTMYIGIQSYSEG